VPPAVRASDRPGPFFWPSDTDALVFAVLRSLAMAGGVVALLLVPLRPEHQGHLAPLVAGFATYTAASLAVLLWRPERAWAIGLATLAADLGFVFLLVWFTGGSESHFYLLFYPLVSLNAYYFGPGLGILGAAVASGLLGAANAVGPSAPWTHVGARAALLGLLGLALGHVAARERAARAEAERLARAVEAATTRLVQAEQLATVGRLSAKMAHEVRNPLGVITLNLDMLGDLVGQCPGPAMGEAHELLRGIREEVRGLAALTDEYLVAARLRRPRREKDSLNDLVAELVVFLRPLADRHGITLGSELGEALPPVAFDRSLLRQALHNLVANALEAAPRGGRVRVQTDADAEAVVVRVTDDGPGVAAEVAARLGEPFVTTKTRGTGLGLSIARQILHEHGGDVTWRNPPGGGAEFALRLPLGGSTDG